MTDQDTLLIAAGGLAALWWAVKHPAAAKGIGLVFLAGIVGFGVAHAAQTRAQRHHRGHRHKYRRMR